MTRRALTLAALAALFLGTLSDRSAPAQERTEGLTDQQFVMLASAMDVAEIKLGKIALKNASRPEVKQFAEKMIADHTKSSKELLSIVNKKAGMYKPATTMDPKHEAAAAKLAMLKGAAFDRAYMKQMVADHKEMVALFQGQADNGKDEDLKAFAEKYLPGVQKHYKMAQQIAAKLKDKDGGGDKGTDVGRDKGKGTDVGGDKGKGTDVGGDKRKDDRDR